MDKKKKDRGFNLAWLIGVLLGFAGLALTFWAVSYTTKHSINQVINEERFVRKILHRYYCITDYDRNAHLAYDLASRGEEYRDTACFHYECAEHIVMRNKLSMDETNGARVFIEHGVFLLDKEKCDSARVLLVLADSMLTEYRNRKGDRIFFIDYGGTYKRLYEGKDRLREICGESIE